MKKTPWFSVMRHNPVRVGWYEVRTTEWHVKRLLWNGSSWYAWQPKSFNDGRIMFGNYKRGAWRGLAEPS